MLLVGVGMELSTFLLPQFLHFILVLFSYTY